MIDCEVLTYKEVAMARIEESIEIKHPVDKVFAYTTDAKNWPKWQSFIPEAEQRESRGRTLQYELIFEE